MSPRAAARLDSLGFSEVYDYVAGKADWFAAGLPVAGAWAEQHVLLDLVRRDVPTCRVTESVADVRDRLRTLGWDRCVVTAGGVVIGEVEPRHLELSDDLVIERAMQEGPRTFRPDFPIEQIARWWNSRQRVATVLVTTQDGVLIGIVRREDVTEHTQPSSHES